jgi:heptaprenyl diphosphate synthase
MRESRQSGVDSGALGLTASPSGADFLQPIRGELATFERRLHDTVHADLGPVAEAMEHILDAGGKRLRPALVILAARLGDPDPEQMYRGAMAIEFIHNATLIHDDLIDRAPTRRGLRTIHESLGPNPAIIIGDYYFAKGANLMSQIGNPRVDLLLSQTVMTICYGEMLQLTSQRKYDQTVQEYEEKIERKTAALLAASTFVGGALAGLSAEHVEALRRFGHLLGMAFQIADDVLDYLSSESEMGKPVGNDLKQGTVTLPLMLALKDPSVRPSLEPVLARAPLRDPDYAAVVALVRGSAAIEDSYEQARLYSQRAAAELAGFPESPYRDALLELTRFVVRRKN